MKLSPFGETIRRIEDERMVAAREAVANGWTEADHPNKCCPHLLEKPAPKPERTPEQRAQYARERAVNFEAKAVRLADKVARLGANNESSTDTAQVNIPMTGRRLQALRRTIKNSADYIESLRQLEYAESRAAHWRAREQETTT